MVMGFCVWMHTVLCMSAVRVCVHRHVVCLQTSSSVNSCARDREGSELEQRGHIWS